MAKDNNLNRLAIKPLIENYMNELTDGEPAISQLTGHVTIKREKEIISKTKELQESLLDVISFKKDITDKINNDKALADTVKDKIDSIKQSIAEAERLIKEIKDKLAIYEVKISKIETDLRNIDSYIRNDLLYKIQELYMGKMTDNYKLLGNLLVVAEKLDLISTSQSYFNNYLTTTFNYLNKNGVVTNYGTENLHNQNKLEIDKRVNRSTYDAYVNDLLTRYAALRDQYGATGSYNIKGAK